MLRDEAEDFVRRLLRRNPDLGKHYSSMLVPKAALEQAGMSFESLSTVPGPESVRDAIAWASTPALETIVNQERPVFFAKPSAEPQAPAMSVDLVDATILGPEAARLRDDLDTARARIEPLLSRIGRIDIDGFASMPFVGTGWIIDDGIVVTNRHVADLVARRDGQGFKFRIGSSGQPVSVAFDTGHFRDAPEGGIAVPIEAVLYIEPESSAVDIAFLKLAPSAQMGSLSPLPIARGAAAADRPLCAIGYPARAPLSVIPDQDLMKELYRDAYDVKRLAPGYLIEETADLMKHDCTTLGGCSGCSVVAMDSGEVVGLHFAGIYKKENQAVPARVLLDYASRRRWSQPTQIETTAKPAQAVLPQAVAPQAPANQTVVTITVTIGGGTPVVAVKGPEQGATSIEAAIAALLDEKRDGVVGGRVGFIEDGGRIGDTPCIAISVRPSRLEEARSNWPAAYLGYPVRYEAATVGEQVDALALAEAPGAIAYDDNARQGPDFQLTPVTEAMSIRAHVSPEYGFAELSKFLSTSQNHQLVSAMYEFKGSAIADLVEGALQNNATMALAIDNTTLPEPKAGGGRRAKAGPAEEAAASLEFEAGPRFATWKQRFGDRFDVVTVPEGRNGLIMMAYHIKVTVRDDDWLWLSSGNWKNTSSQPIVTQAQLDNAAAKDLPGNRDWHVVMQSKALATRFRSHIRQDIKRSRELIAQKEAVPSAELMILVPDAQFEAAIVERRPPSHILSPLVVTGQVQATPILTPDHDGRVYTDAVLRLIRSARTSLWFQIPYIGMRSDPRVHRGNIDELIDALVEKLTNLEDARVLLRTGNAALSDNRHVAWYFKSKGVDVANRVRAIDNHHTKGMVVDGARVLIGSHNWSSQGVSVNRDASIIFEHADLARYYGDALDIDWQRANPVAPVQFVKKMPEVLLPSDPRRESVGFTAISLSDYLAEMDD